MNSICVYVLLLFSSFSLLAQDLTINIDNKTLFLKGFCFEKEVVIDNDTSIFLNPGIYNFYNDSIDFTIWIDDEKDYELSLKHNNVFFNGLNDLEFDFLSNFFFKYKSLSANVELFDLNPDEYEILMYNIRKKLNIFLEQHTDFELFNQNFRNLLINYIDLIYYNSLCDYILNYENSNKIFDYKIIPYFLDESFYFESAKKNFNLYLHKKYLYNMTKLLSYKNSFSNKEQSIRVFFSSFFQFARKYLSQEYINSCLIQFISDHSSNINQSFFDEIINLTHNLSKKEKEYVIKQYNFNKQEKENDYEISFSVDKYDFHLENIFGDKVSFDDFLGKVLYIDIWASWCGPCRKLFPFSSQLKKKFNRRQLKKIDFIYVSIDNDYAKWKKSINQLNIDGENFISPADKENGISQYFQVSSIPRYIIIDKSGEIVQQNAKRPNDESLFNDLLELINDF